MSFLSPAFLWGLLTLIPLIGIYFLKVRPRRQQTSAYFLWEKVLEERRSRALFRRLRDLLSLILLAMAFVFVVLALADPVREGGPHEDVVLVIDASASMQAGDPSRFTRAKAVARKRILGMRGHQRAAIATWANDLHLHAHLTADPRALLASLDDLKPTALPGPRGALGESPPTRVLITDRFHDLPETVEQIAVGRQEANIGIVAADLQALPDGELGLYFQLVSTFGEPVRIDITLRHEATDTLGKVIAVEVLPGTNAPEVYRLASALRGAWLLQVEQTDALPLDNVVPLVVTKRPPIRVGVALEEGYFFQQAILSFAEHSGLALEVDDPDVVLTLGQVSEAERSLVFQPDGESPWWHGLGDDLDNPVPVVTTAGHPALRYLDVSSMRFDGARAMTAPDDAVVLVASDRGVPLIYESQRESQRVIVVNMDPALTESRLSPWFPVLIHGAATHLAGQTASYRSAYATGEWISLPPSARVIAPDGQEHNMGGEGVYGPLDAIGVHTIDLEEGVPSRAFGVGLLNATESLLGAGQSESPSGTRTAASLPWSWWLTLFAIGILVVESILYHRRRVG